MQRLAVSLCSGPVSVMMDSAYVVWDVEASFQDVGWWSDLLQTRIHCFAIHEPLLAVALNTG